jgi:CDP-6-deoxy-D-xylo-4-hexulose-3-dehydrase
MKWNLMDNAISFSDKLKLSKFVLSTNRFTNGEKVLELESEWNKWLGSKYSLFVSSGSTANFLLVAAIKELYGLKTGDKVLVPACTWMTNVAPIIQLGLQPIFCDINFGDFSFDHDDLEYISQQHKDIKLIFVTHLLGFPSTASTFGILKYLFPKAIVIDDVCESHGCLDSFGNKIGSNSIGATFSTYFGHHLTTIEGGFVSTSNQELYDLMKMKRSHGLARESINFKDYADQHLDIDKQFLFITDGYNFRNTELGAVLGLSQLSKLDKSINIRNKNYKMYCDIMIDSSDLFYNTNHGVGVSSFCFPFVCKSSDIYNNLKRRLQTNNIEYRPIVSGNLLKQPFLKDYTLCTNKNYYNVDYLHTHGLYIGNSQFVGRNHIKKLEDIINEL